MQWISEIYITVIQHRIQEFDPFTPMTQNLIMTEINNLFDDRILKR